MLLGKKTNKDNKYLVKYLILGFTFQNPLLSILPNICYFYLVLSNNVYKLLVIFFVISQKVTKKNKLNTHIQVAVQDL